MTNDLEVLPVDPSGLATPTPEQHAAALAWVKWEWRKPSNSIERNGGLHFAMELLERHAPHFLQDPDPEHPDDPSHACEGCAHDADWFAWCTGWPCPDAHAALRFVATVRALPSFTTIHIQPDPLDGGYVASVLDVPGVVSQGETMTEAYENVMAAVTEVLSPPAATINSPRAVS